MNITYISRKTAILAKEKKFNWEVDSYYLTKHNDYVKKQYEECGIALEDAIFPTHYHDVNSMENEFYGPVYSCCSQSLLQKWLREVHKIHMVVSWYDEEDKFYFELGLKRGEMRYSQTGTTSNLFETYEEALEAGLVDGLNKIEI